FGCMFFPPIGVEREYAQRPIIGHVRCAGHDMDTSVGNGDAAATSFFDMFDPCEDGPGFGSQRSPKLSDQFIFEYLWNSLEEDIVIVGVVRCEVVRVITDG